MRELYILRHGIAEPRKKGLADQQRQLTEEGRKKLDLVLARARAAKVSPNLIVTSPFIRAVQTAEAAAQALAANAKIIHSESLVPGSSPDAVWNEVRRHLAKGSVLIAGHEPLLSEAISFLVGVNQGIIDFKKGALACLNVDPKQKSPRAALQWLITPKLCQPDRRGAQ
jgi:phosphohistidine phosphatase